MLLMEGLGGCTPFHFLQKVLDIFARKVTLWYHEPCFHSSTSPSSKTVCSTKRISPFSGECASAIGSVVRAGWRTMTRLVLAQR